LLGERKIVPLEIKNLFQDIGIAHILAVSGLHVGFIFIFFFSIFRFLHLNEEISRLLCLFFIFLYALITGFKPSVARASLMIAFLIIAPLFYRKSSSISNLFLAFWVLLLLNPLLIYNIGFQLSFIATLGILIFTPILGEYFQGRFKKLVIFVAVSISAWLSILPLLLHYFHKISLLAIFINILAIPLVALIVWFGFISFLLFNLSPYLGEILGSINSTLIDLLLFITQKFESIPFGVIYVSEFSLPFIIVYYIIFLALAIYLMNIISQKVDLPKFA
jgi:competence protein ComEC